MTKNKVFWGIIFIALAAVLLLYAFLPQFSLGGISLWQIIAGAAILYWLINNLFFGDSIRKRLDIFLPLSLLFIVFERNIAHLVGRPENFANNWVVLIAGILLTVAVHLLCGKKKSNVTRSSGVRSSKMAASVVYIDVLTQKSESVNNRLSDMSVFFQNTDIDTSTDPITLSVDNKLGNISIHVPENWAVHNRVDNSLGDVSLRSQTASPVRTLIIEGKNRLGEISVN